MEAVESRIVDGSLTIYEWESLSIDAENYSILKAAISPSEGEALRELDVLDYPEPRIRAGHHVGAISFRTPLRLAITADDGSTQVEQIVILPKLVAPVGEVGEGRWIDIIRMFEVAYRMRFPDIGDAARLMRRHGLASLVAWLYANELERLFRKHLRRNYVMRTETLNGRLKGKLQVGRYLETCVARYRPQNVVCQFYELTADTLLNRVIKAGLRRCRQVIAKATKSQRADTELSGRLARMMGLMASVSDIRVTSSDLARIRLHRLNRHYHQAVTIARLLIFDKSFDYQVGNPPVQVGGLVFDMNILFERFIAGTLELSSYSIKYQHSSGVVRHFSSQLGSNATSTGQISLRPDFIVRTPGGATIIADAKYKRLFDTPRTSKRQDSVEADLMLDDEVDSAVYACPKVGDIYQMVSYLDNRPDAEAGVLIYPWLGSGIRTTRVTGFRNKEIALVALGLSDVDALSKQDWLRMALHACKPA